MKAEGRRLLSAAPLCAALLCVFAGVASAQKRPKPALSTKDARRAIAAAPRFGLSTGAVKVKSVGPAGSAPVRVEADVKLAFRFERVEDERVPQTGGVFKTKRWRAVEFRTGDRSWAEFELISSPAFAPRVEAARRALEELVTEFEARQSKVGAGWGATARDVEGEAVRVGESAAKKNKEEKREEEKKAAEPLTRGPLTVKQLSLMGSSAVAEVVVAATFSLERDARGRWRVSEVSAGGESSGDLEELWRAADARKAERARTELAAVAAALEAFRRERGFYVVARDSVVLFDHLSPRYAERIIRLDPWHNPYRYAGTAATYTLASDGPDGKPNTADDVTLLKTMN
jgi:Type II secretion system (T2SS), protein G